MAGRKLNDLSSDATGNKKQTRMERCILEHTRKIWFIWGILWILTATGSLLLGIQALTSRTIDVVPHSTKPTVDETQTNTVPSPTTELPNGTVGPPEFTTAEPGTNVSTSEKAEEDFKIGVVLSRPCDDFFEATCQSHPQILLNDPMGTYAFLLAKEHLFAKLNKILDEGVGNSTSQSWKDAVTLYGFCMNYERDDESGWESLKKLVQSLGSAPMIDKEWNKKGFRWENLVVALKNVNFFEPSFVSVEVVPRKESYRIIVRPVPMNWVFANAAIGGIGTDFRKAARAIMCDVLYPLGVNEIKDRQTCEWYLASPIIELELQLAEKIHEDETSSSRKKAKERVRMTREKTEEREMNIIEMENDFPNVMWRTLLNSFLVGKPKVTDDEMILVKQPTILDRVLELVNSQDGSLQANYLMWKFIGSFRFYLPTGRDKKQFEDSDGTYPEGEEQPRWMGCVEDVIDTFPITLRNEYQLKHSLPEIETKVGEIFGDIKAGFIELFKKMRWVNNDDRENEIRRIKNITLRQFHIGTINETFLDHFELKNNSVETLLELNRLKMGRHYNLLENSSDQMDTWLTKIDIEHLSPRYSEERNELYIPLECLQEVFFNKEGPSYKNYGALGVQIALEIARGFRRNKTHSVDQQCLIKQFSSYVVWLTLLVDGNYTLDENLYDHMGFRAAYLAYQILLKRNQSLAHESRGTHYDNRQNFWISAAQLLCAKFTGSTILRAHAASQSPAQYRVNGVFSNFQDFHRDFKCSEGCLMHKKGFCSLE